jgi:predicted lipid-binding transport protein (Tim44 family)
MLSHRPSRQWFGEVMPGTWAPNVEGDGVDGKIAGVAAIHSHDPGFDENVFLGEVQRRFFTILTAWTGQRPELSQGVMAAQIWQQQKAQVDSYVAQQWKNQLDGLTFTSAIVAGAASENGYDTATVRINANSADFDVDAAGRMIRGDRQARDWTEDWIFQRPSTMSTAKGSRSAPNSCANCGAPLAAAEGICPYCKAPLGNGNFGWLLTRIDRI